MNSRFSCILLYLFTQFTSAAQDCKGIPGFIAGLGFNPQRSAMSTTERKFMGVVLVELNDPANTSSGRNKFYQDPSWKSAGYLGAICTDRQGNLFILPKPQVNMLHNPPAEQNTMYKVDSKSGKLQSFVKLPMKKMPHEKNPYGLSGIFFDCQNDAIIASSIAGSSPSEELGKIYSVHSNTKNYFEILDRTDALGVAVLTQGSERRLYYGLCRKSELWSIPVDARNKPTGKPRLEISLDGIGPRGDDRIRKIRFNNMGLMELTGISFFYNLAAAYDLPESVYSCKFNPQTGKWQLVEIR